MTTISGALLALSAPPATIAGAFGAVCSRCNKGYETKNWRAPWMCPRCVVGEMDILRRSGRDRTGPEPLVPLFIDGWGAGS